MPDLMTVPSVCAGGLAFASVGGDVANMDMASPVIIARQGSMSLERSILEFNPNMVASFFEKNTALKSLIQTILM